MVKTKSRKSVIHTGTLRTLEQTTEKGEPMREKLIEILDQAGTMRQFPGSLARILIENGVTIPVRCKDCAKEWCYLRQELGADGYCSSGERKNNG